MGAEHIWEGKTAKCGECRFYQDGIYETGTTGECRLEPPSITGLYPPVHRETSWCGSFTPVDESV